MSIEPFNSAELSALLAQDDAAPGGEALERAALVSFFDLNWLAQQSGDSPRQKSVVLNASEPLDASLDLWRLRANERVGQLELLARRPDLLAKRLDEATPMPTDAVGLALQTIMRGKQGKPVEAEDDETLEATFEAATWLRAVPAMQSPDPRAIRRELSRRRRLRRMRETSARFVGRQDVLDRLDRFADDAIPKGPEIEVLPLFGIGGIGKSALLARFLRDRTGASEPGASTPLMFHLDFDRAGATAFGPVEWTFELNRQLAFLLPSVAAELDLQRKQAQKAYNARDRSAGGFSSASEAAGLEGIIHSEDDALYGLLDLALRLNIAGRTLLMVFDTVEALQVRSVDGLSRLGEWITTLRQKAGFSDIRVVLSGRVQAALPSTGWFRQLEPIPLDDLGPAHAAALLERLGVEPAQAAPVVEAFGGNPLILRLVAQLAKRMGIDVAGLAGSLEQRAQADKELVQGILYDRILTHIDDAVVQKLAHPGLALRRVDWGVIRHVLAPTCLGSEIDEAEARRLYRSLAGEVWLVDPAPDGGEGVVHRSDLRKLTMTLIWRDPDEVRRVERVYRAAIDHYETGPSRHAAHAGDEALYCRFMVRGGGMLPHLDDAAARRASDAIGTDRDELPHGNRVALSAALDEGVELDDALGLPDFLWARYVNRRGEELVRREAYADALELLERRPVPDAAPASPWRMSALDALARWDEMFERLHKSIRRGAAGPLTVPLAASWLMAGLKAGGAAGRSHAWKADVNGSVGRHAPGTGTRRAKPGDAVGVCRPDRLGAATDQAQHVRLVVEPRACVRLGQVSQRGGTRRSVPPGP